MITGFTIRDEQGRDDLPAILSREYLREVGATIRKIKPTHVDAKTEE